MQGLLVERALTGDHQVGPVQRLGEAENVEHDVDTGPEGRVETDERSVADTARGTGSRRLRGMRRGGATGLGEHLDEPSEGGVEGGHVLLGGALLRAVDGRGALRAEQRVVDVAGEHHLGVGQPRVEPGEVRGGEGGQRPAAGTDRRSVRVEQAGPERDEHAGPAVVGGAAADAEHDGARTVVQRGAQQLTGAVGGGRERREDALRQVPQAGGLGHLDHGGGVTYGVRGGHGLAQRPGHLELTALEAGRDRRVDGAVTAVGDR